MDMNKYAMLKAILNQKDYITVSSLKSELSITGEEAEEMITNLGQEGMVEPYPIDGLHFKVIK